MFAELARMKLKEAGIDVWIDKGDIRVGDIWRDSIDRGISRCAVALIVLTPESCESPYVTYEWAFALGQGKKVIPVLLSDSKIHPRLDVIQHLDFRDYTSGPWDQLFAEIRAFLNKNERSEAETPIGEMAQKDLQDLIVGAVALANATAKSSGLASAGKEDLSNAVESVVGAAHRSPDRRGKHILWVDDRPHNNKSERSAFEALGFEFTLALSTSEALDLLAERSYSAIISDMGRVEGSREGYVLLEAVRERDKKIPFFIYAGSNRPEHKIEAAKRGAQGSTNSPQDLFELVSNHVI